jgi:hypothetical protein
VKNERPSVVCKSYRNPPLPPGRVDGKLVMNGYVAAPKTTVLGYELDMLTSTWCLERSVSIPTTVSTLSVFIRSCNVAATYLPPLYRHPYALYISQQYSHCYQMSSSLQVYQNWWYAVGWYQPRTIFCSLAALTFILLSKCRFNLRTCLFFLQF